MILCHWHCLLLWLFNNLFYKFFSIFICSRIINERSSQYIGDMTILLFDTMFWLVGHCDNIGPLMSHAPYMSGYETITQSYVTIVLEN